MLDAATATLIAAITAAIASIGTLLFKIRSGANAERRVSNRLKLQDLIDDLGDAIYKIVACCTLRLRDRDKRNERYWEGRIQEARGQLRKIRPRVRYQLWGIDDGLKALIMLPDWTTPKSSPEDGGRLIAAAHVLRGALDETIRRCYADGRTPTKADQRRVADSVASLFEVARSMGYGPVEDGSLAPEAAPVEVPYVKSYATVFQVDGDEMLVDLENGQRVSIRKANRSGKGSLSEVVAGKRVKVYKRPGEDFYRYRFVGG